MGRGDERRNLADHVLDTFDKDEQPVASEAIVRAADAAEVFVSDGLAPMMNKFNRREDKEEDRS